MYFLHLFKIIWKIGQSKYSYCKAPDINLQIMKNKKTRCFILFKLKQRQRKSKNNTENVGSNESVVMRYSTQKSVQKNLRLKYQLWGESSLIVKYVYFVMFILCLHQVVRVNHLFISYNSYNIRLFIVNTLQWSSILTF